MVGRVILIGKRHAIIGDIKFPVLEAADLRLAFGQADPVGTAVVGDTRTDQRERVEVGGGRQRVLDIAARRSTAAGLRPARR